MSFMKVPTPDFSKATDTSEDMVGNILSSYHPSAAATDEEAELENKMRNADFDTGLSGSTLEAQSLGEGEAKALDQDQQQYVHEVLGVEPQVVKGQTAAAAANKELPFQLAGDVAGVAGDIAAPFTGGLTAGIGKGVSSLLKGAGADSSASPVSGLSGGDTSGLSGPLSNLLKNPQALMKILQMAGKA